MVRIYNTITRRKEDFKPLEEGKVSMYVCGPTVYNYIHIGNARPAIAFDTVRRYLEYKGYEVKYVSNFTDVDDKLIKASKELGETVPEIAERFFSEAAFKGEKRAVERMIRLSSQGPMPNPRLCLRWLFKGAEAKIPYCLLAIARYWLEHRTPGVEKALGFLEEGALIEDIACLNELSAFWSSGRFAPKDYVSAVVYAHMAATRSDWRAQRRLEKLRKTAQREELMEAAAIASMPSSEEVVAALIKRRQKRAA